MAGLSRMSQDGRREPHWLASSASSTSRRQAPTAAGWACQPVCGERGHQYGLLLLSDKAGGADFTPEDNERIRELAAFAGATLEALRAARRTDGLRREAVRRRRDDLVGGPAGSDGA
jgi:hypothetical protein